MKPASTTRPELSNRRSGRSARARRRDAGRSRRECRRSGRRTGARAPGVLRPSGRRARPRSGPRGCEAHGAGSSARRRAARGRHRSRFETRFLERDPNRATRFEALERRTLFECSAQPLECRRAGHRASPMNGRSEREGRGNEPPSLVILRTREISSAAADADLRRARARGSERVGVQPNVRVTNQKRPRPQIAAEPSSATRS